MELKKDITFIYEEQADKTLYSPLMEEAKRRGYSARLTNNKFERCEIGVYCQHVNFPQYSKFSVIMLHDIIQQYGNWPDIWFREPWDKYDIGFLPSATWVENWRQASKYYYARTKKGIYKTGWPKADSVAAVNKEDYKEKLCGKYGLDINKRTILYAPAWENDCKQDEFVQAMLPLDVNILIKQTPATPETFPDIYKNIMEMYELHKDNPRVTILDPKLNIFDAIIASDVLVSEESSTMAEAVMMGIPAVSVSNWLIPDVTPSRFPACNYDFVVMTKKEKLTECIREIVGSYSRYQSETQMWRDRIFCNIGKASLMFFDVLDSFVDNGICENRPLKPSRREKLSMKQYLKHKYIAAVRAMDNNYTKRYAYMADLWNFMKKIKKIFYEKPIVS